MVKTWTQSDIKLIVDLYILDTGGHWTCAHRNIIGLSRTRISLPLLLQSMCLKQATRSTRPRH